MSKLTLLLLVLSLIGISKPTKADPYAVTMFALPFVGAIFNQALRDNSYPYDEEFQKNYVENRKNLHYIPIGGCKVFTEHLPNGGTSTGRACKQADGSWKVE